LLIGINISAGEVDFPRLQVAKQAKVGYNFCVKGEVNAMRVRFTVRDDLEACVQMAPQVFYNEALRDAYIQTLDSLLASGRALSVVVVDETDVPRGFGLSLFISDQLRDTIRRGPYPIADYLLSGARQRGAILRARQPREIERAHQGDGLNLLGFYGWRNDIEPVQMERVRNLLGESFLHLHRGYHLKSFLKEIYDNPQDPQKSERRFYRELGCQVYRECNSYTDAKFRNAYAPSLVGITRHLATRPENRCHMTSLLFRAGSPAIHIPARLRKVAQIEFVLEQCFHTDIAHHHKRLFFRNNNNNHNNINYNNIFNIYMYTLFQRIRSHLRRQQLPLRFRRDRFHERRYVEQHPEVLYPLEIHTLFYNHPELARSYALPL
jgi:hypothetical protein